jgi:hypothetical protein
MYKRETLGDNVDRKKCREELNRKSSVGVVTRLPAGQPRDHGLIPGRGKK